jgi:mono/diheme cytochrome c family protein
MPHTSDAARAAEAWSARLAPLRRGSLKHRSLTQRSPRGRPTLAGRIVSQRRARNLFAINPAVGTCRHAVGMLNARAPFRSSPKLVLAAALLAAPAWAVAQGGSRGELLYATHCVTCHTEQMHWRVKKQATDWTSLKVQVRRWQGNASLNWSDDDVAEVARYLNARFYRFAPTGVPLTSLRRVPPG